MIAPSLRRDGRARPLAFSPLFATSLAALLAATSLTGRAQGAQESAGPGTTAGTTADSATSTAAAPGPSVARSWQRQTLLAAGDTEYLVLETEGHNPGTPDVWTETVRLVRIDATNNERGAAELVRVEVWTEGTYGTREVDTVRSSEVSLGTMLDTFEGELVPAAATRLRRRFHADEAGVFVLGDGERRVEIFNREEIERCAEREPHRPGLPNLQIVGMQQLGEQFFLTLRAGTSNSRRELVMRILR